MYYVVRCMMPYLGHLVRYQWTVQMAFFGIKLYTNFCLGIPSTKIPPTFGHIERDAENLDSYPQKGLGVGLNRCELNWRSVKPKKLNNIWFCKNYTPRDKLRPSVDTSRYNTKISGISTLWRLPKSHNSIHDSWTRTIPNYICFFHCMHRFM